MRRVAAVLGVAVLTLAGTMVSSATAQAAGAVVIYKVQYNSPGTDTRSNKSLNGEYVVIKNTSKQTKTITGYRLQDEAGHRYVFGTTKLKPGKVIYVRTGKGTNNYLNRYWGRSWHVWNNTGDTAYLRSPNNRLLDKCSWGSKGSAKYC
ncbi:lamin tail domain-containing protein [Thermocrispum sp.]|uniref:lamin tail domain-containing protein n=1 Tax=Thermocrispum sp. TaxID=2060768 RepID=UPI002579B72C|nr:lamin tail domain-containing protein [Thermocrispum sp.]